MNTCRSLSGTRTQRSGERSMVVLVALLTLLMACDSFGGDSEEARDGNSGTPDPRRAGLDTLFLDAAQVVGLVGDPEYLFGSIASVAADADGRLYVADGSDVSVRVFEADGTFRGWIAREGGGPGEVYQKPADLIFGADGRLYVRDGARVTVFGRRVGSSVTDSVVGLWNTPGLGNLTSSRSAVALDGRYFYPGGHHPSNEFPRYFYASYTQGEMDGDTLEVPAYPGLKGLRPALFPLGAVDALRLPGLNRVPFSPVPVWDVTPEGTLLSVNGASPELLETDMTGDTVRTIRLPVGRPRPIPASERADSLAALEQRVTAAERRITRFQGRLTQVIGLGEGVQQGRLPDSLPTVIGLRVTQNGSIWVERWPPEGEQDSRYYDVLDRSGRLLQVVVLRAALLRSPSAWFGQNSVAGIIREQETGVEKVARFDLP